MKNISRIIIISIVFIFVFAQRNIDWEKIGNPDEAFDGYVYAITVDSMNNVYVGGRIRSIGDLHANNIAMWDGNTWTTLGRGFNDSVEDLVITPKGRLYACGSFSANTDFSYGCIAEWTGKEWKKIGQGLNYFVRDMTFDNNGNLYAGGIFKNSGNTKVNGVAKWNGSSWSALGSGISGGDYPHVQALEFDRSGNLYVGGSFNRAGDVAVNNIAKWDGSSWSALGGDAFYVSAIKCDTLGNIYAGISFYTNNGQLMQKVVKWNGLRWETLGNPFSNSIYDLELDKDQNLYLGTYSNPGTQSTFPYVSKWDGEQWQNLGMGVDNDGIIRLYFDGKSRLYMGGYFTNAGGKPSPRLASLIIHPQKVVYSNGEDMDLSLNKGKNNQTIGRFALKTDSPLPYLIHADISIKGNNKGLTNFKLWESKNDTLNFEQDTLLALISNPDIVSDKLLQFNDFKSMLEVNPTYYYITCDTDDNASGTFSLNISNNDALGICGGVLESDINNEILSGKEISFNSDIALKITNNIDSTLLFFGWLNTTTDSFDIGTDQYYHSDSSNSSLISYFDTDNESLIKDYRKSPDLHTQLIWNFKIQSDTPIVLEWDPESLPSVGQFSLANNLNDFSHHNYINMKDTNKLELPKTTDNASMYLIYSVFHADFNTDITVGHHPLTVNFHDLSEGDIKNWVWNFGDGQSSNEQNPSHTYRKKGKYSVFLRVYDGENISYCVKPNLIDVTNAKHAIIYNVVDVPNDQGSWVFVNFSPSIYDTDSPNYLEKKQTPEIYTIEINDGNGWIAANSTVAYAKNKYTVLVHTTCDSSTTSNGHIDFRVVAGMNEGTYISNTVTAYSIDNIAPEAPTGTHSTITPMNIELKWDASEAEDIDHYNVYRSEYENPDHNILEIYGVSTNTAFKDTSIEDSKTYFYLITAVDIHGNESIPSEETSIYVEIDNIPEKFILCQNYPNPFNPSTTIKYGLPETTDITLEIFSINGQKVNNWHLKQQTFGWHTFTWNGRDISGNLLPTGLYIYKLQTSSFVQTKKMILMK